MSVKRILLTGGSGFVGRNVIEYCDSSLGDKYLIDAPRSSELDVLSEEAVHQYLASHDRYDIVLHFAVYTDAIDKSKNGEMMLPYNLKSFLNFYKYRDMYGKMFYAGSGAEYDKSSDIFSVTEDDIHTRSIPSDPYGLMKYTIGEMIEQSENIYNLRIFGLFGKYEYSFRFITDMCNRAIAGQDLVVNQNVYFDYTYITDFCRLLFGLLDKKDLKYHTYNMVSGKRISLLEICEMVNDYRLSKNPSNEKLTVVVRQEGLNKEYTASNIRIMEELPSFVFMKMEDAVAELYDILEGCV